jgi:putative oxidoreductase
MTRPTRRVARAALGLAFVVFGANGFLHFMPVPPARPAAESLITALIQTGYFFQMVKLIELSSGFLLLVDRLVPLGLLLLAPLLVGITSIHLFLNPEGLPLMLVLLALYGYVLSGYWTSFRPLLAARVGA